MCTVWCITLLLRINKIVWRLHHYSFCSAWIRLRNVREKRVMYTSTRNSCSYEKNKNMCESVRIRKTKNNGAETLRNYISFDYSMIHEQCIDAMLHNMTHRNNIIVGIIIISQFGTRKRLGAIRSCVNK